MKIPLWIKGLITLLAYYGPVFGLVVRALISFAKPKGKQDQMSFPRKFRGKRNGETMGVLAVKIVIAGIVIVVLTFFWLLRKPSQSKSQNFCACSGMEWENQEIFSKVHKKLSNQSKESFPENSRKGRRKKCKRSELQRL